MVHVVYKNDIIEVFYDGSFLELTNNKLSDISEINGLESLKKLNFRYLQFLLKYRFYLRIILI